MINEKYIELINKEIDGLTTKGEKERLHTYLGENPEAQKFYQQMGQTINFLNQVSEVDSPPILKDRIMNSIDLNRYSVRQKQSLFKSLFSNIFTKPNPRLAYAFVFGVVFGILFYSLFLAELTRKQGVNITDLYGTIGLSEVYDFKTLDSIPINLPEISGNITVKKLKNIVAIEIDLKSSVEFEILLEFDKSHLSFNHFVPINQAKTLVEKGENYVKTTNEGHIQYNLFLVEKAKDISPLYLKLILTGENRFRYKIDLSRK